MSIKGIRDAPVLHPTVEEFRNPMRYFESIRAIGEEFGIAVIQPPPCFNPGFSLDPKKVKFFTRQQNLHMVGAAARAETEFMLKVRLFMFQSRHPLPTVAYVIKGQPVSFRDLYLAVADFGGYDEVEKATGVWPLLLRELFPKLGDFFASAPPKEIEDCASSLRGMYKQVLYRFERRCAESNEQTSLHGDGAGDRKKKKKGHGVASRRKKKAKSRTGGGSLREAFETVIVGQCTDDGGGAGRGPSSSASSTASSASSPGTTNSSSTSTSSTSLSFTLSTRESSQGNSETSSSNSTTRSRRKRTASAAIGPQTLKLVVKESPSKNGKKRGKRSIFGTTDAEKADPSSVPAANERQQLEMSAENANDFSHGGSPTSKADTDSNGDVRKRGSSNEIQDSPLFDIYTKGDALLQVEVWRYIPELEVALLGRIVAVDDSLGYRMHYDLAESSTSNHETARKLMKKNKRMRRLLFNGHFMGHLAEQAGNGRCGRRATRRLPSGAHLDPPPFFCDYVSHDDIAIILAAGASKAEAEEAFKSGVCQECLRANREDQMLMCDFCDMTYHMDCLKPPLRRVPEGDWFCSACVHELSRKGRRRFGFQQEATPVGISEFRDRSRQVVREFLGNPEAPVLADGADLDDLSAIPDFVKRATNERTASNANDSGTASNQAERGAVDIYDAVPICDWSDERHLRIVSQLEAAFWNATNTPAARAPHKWDAAHHKFVPVAMPYYGADIDTGASGSGFPQRPGFTVSEGSDERGLHSTKRQRRRRRRLTAGAQVKVEINSRWNLNALPYARGSLLKHIPEDITGITVPWMYFGMACSTFCWHTEDHYFYSINYVHWGAPKVWYGLPSSAAASFDALLQRRYADLMASDSPHDRGLLADIVTMVDPAVLLAAGLPVCRAVQQPGQFVVTFPRTYHAGFNAGINCAEAVNFASASWLPYAGRAGDLRAPVIDTCDLLLRSIAALVDDTSMRAEYSSQLPKNVPVEAAAFMETFLAQQKALSTNAVQSTLQRAPSFAKAAREKLVAAHISLLDVVNFLERDLVDVLQEGEARRNDCEAILKQQKTIQNDPICDSVDDTACSASIPALKRSRPSTERAEFLPSCSEIESQRDDESVKDTDEEALQCGVCRAYAVLCCVKCSICGFVCCGARECFAAAQSDACNELNGDDSPSGSGISDITRRSPARSGAETAHNWINLGVRPIAVIHVALDSLRSKRQEAESIKNGILRINADQQAHHRAMQQLPESPKHGVSKPVSLVPVMSLTEVNKKIAEARIHGVASNLPEFHAVCATVERLSKHCSAVSARLKSSGQNIVAYKKTFRSSSSRDESQLGVSSLEQRRYNDAQVTVTEAKGLVGELRTFPYSPDSLIEQLNDGISRVEQWCGEVAELLLVACASNIEDSSNEATSASSCAQDGGGANHEWSMDESDIDALVQGLRQKYTELMGHISTTGVACDHDVLILVTNVLDHLMSGRTLIQIVGAWQHSDGAGETSPMARQHDYVVAAMAKRLRKTLRRDVAERGLERLLGSTPGAADDKCAAGSTVHSLAATAAITLCSWGRSATTELQRALRLFENWEELAEASIRDTAIEPVQLERLVADAGQLALTSRRQMALLRDLEVLLGKIKDWLQRCHDRKLLECCFPLVSTSVTPVGRKQSEAPLSPTKLSKVLSLYRFGTESLGVSKSFIAPLHSLAAACEAWLNCASAVFAPKSLQQAEGLDLTSLVQVILQRHDRNQRLANDLRQELKVLRQSLSDSALAQQVQGSTSSDPNTYSPTFSKILGRDLDPVHCVCRHPEGEELGFFQCGTMLCCDRCEQWYHPECIGIPANNVSAAAASETWVCMYCTEKGACATSLTDSSKQLAQTDEERFCLCQRPYHENSVMVGCDSCERWFHPACIWLNNHTIENEVAAASAAFLCPFCSAMRGFLFYPPKRCEVLWSIQSDPSSDDALKQVEDCPPSATDSNTQLNNKKSGRKKKAKNVAESLSNIPILSYVQPLFTKVQGLISQAATKLGPLVEVPELTLIKTAVDSATAWYATAEAALSDLELPHDVSSVMLREGSNSPFRVAASELQILALQAPLVCLRLPKMQAHQLSVLLEAAVEACRATADWQALVLKGLATQISPAKSNACADGDGPSPPETSEERPASARPPATQKGTATTAEPPGLVVAYSLRAYALARMLQSLSALSDGKASAKLASTRGRPRALPIDLHRCVCTVREVARPIFSQAEALRRIWKLRDPETVAAEAAAAAAEGTAAEMDKGGAGELSQQAPTHHMSDSSGKASPPQSSETVSFPASPRRGRSVSKRSVAGELKCSAAACTSALRLLKTLLSDEGRRNEDALSALSTVRKRVRLLEAEQSRQRKIKVSTADCAESESQEDARRLRAELSQLKKRQVDERVKHSQDLQQLQQKLESLRAAKNAQITAAPLPTRTEDTIHRRAIADLAPSTRNNSERVLVSSTWQLKISCDNCGLDCGSESYVVVTTNQDLCPKCFDASAAWRTPATKWKYQRQGIDAEEPSARQSGRQKRANATKSNVLPDEPAAVETDSRNVRQRRPRKILDL